MDISSLDAAGKSGFVDHLRARARRFSGWMADRRKARARERDIVKTERHLREVPPHVLYDLGLDETQVRAMRARAPGNHRIIAFQFFPLDW